MTLDDIMLDPSVMVSSKSLAATETRLDRVQRGHKGIDFHISRSFRDFVNRLETKEQLEDSAVFKFFGNGEPAEITYLRDFVDRFDESAHGVSREYRYEYEGNSVQLYSAFKDDMWFYNRYDYPKYLYGIMADEYDFVNTQSILSIDTEKVLERFKELGAVTVEIGERVFERMVERTLDLDETEEEILTKANITRTFGKYALIGGSTVTSQFSGILASVIIPTSFGIILAIDPEVEELEAA